MIYDIDSTQLSNCYNKQGTSLDEAYDVSGNEVFSSGQTVTFNVMTYNVQLWSGRNANTSLVEGMFESTNPLIVGLQECRDVGTGGYVPDTFAYGAMAENVNNPTAIMSQIPFESFASTIYTGGVREYTKCYITIGGKRIAWFNTHVEGYTEYDSSNYWNQHVSQMNQIFEIISEEDSFILTGDFNVEGSQEYNDCLKQFVDAGFNMSNWTQSTGFVDTYFNGTTVANSTSKKPTDNIITSPDLTITNIEYNTAKLSITSGQIDHIPIIATIVILNDQS